MWNPIRAVFCRGDSFWREIPLGYFMEYIVLIWVFGWIGKGTEQARASIFIVSWIFFIARIELLDPLFSMFREWIKVKT